MADPILSDRIALAVCRSTGNPDGLCLSICRDCRRDSAAVAHEIANWLRERDGGASTNADLLDRVGCHQPDAEPSIQDGWKALECEQDQRMWPPMDPKKVAAALAIAREPRGPDG
jgi:hypothetical protein